MASHRKPKDERPPLTVAGVVAALNVLNDALEREALISGSIRLGEAVLADLGVEVDEAGTYYYDTVLVKRSVLGDSNSGPCENCDENSDEGWIDSESVYPSGHDGPPFHPNCVCEEEYKEKRVRVYF